MECNVICQAILRQADELPFERPCMNVCPPSRLGKPFPERIACHMTLLLSFDPCELGMRPETMSATQELQAIRKIPMQAYYDRDTADVQM